MLAIVVVLTTFVDIPAQTAAEPDYTFIDGWHSAVVRMEDQITGIPTAYTMRVLVEFDRVIAINLRYGKTAELNSPGELYEGGFLTLERGEDDEIAAAVTRVTVTNRDGTISPYEVRMKMPIGMVKAETKPLPKPTPVIN